MSVAWRRGVLWSIAVAATGTAAVLACGPFFNDLLTVSHSVPADPRALCRRRAGRGEAGVRAALPGAGLPRARRRAADGPGRSTGGGAAPATTAVQPVASAPGARAAGRRDADAQADQSGTHRRGLLVVRQLPRRGLRPRPRGLCGTRGAVRRPQPRNHRLARRRRPPCSRTAPPGRWSCRPPPPSRPTQRMKADRDYQTAAAYFYATQYDEAAGRFRAIAGNAASPWRPSGRYMAARALIRSVTVPVDPAQGRGPTARRGRARPAGNAGRSRGGAAACLGPWAPRPHRRTRAADRAAPRALGTSRHARQPSTPQDLVDYTWLMDLALGETAAGTPPLDLAEVTKGDDMTDWIVAMQKRQARALERWRDTRSERWLVAALWTASPGDTDVPALLAAAAQVPRTSPAFCHGGVPARAPADSAQRPGGRPRRAGVAARRARARLRRARPSTCCAPRGSPWRRRSTSCSRPRRARSSRRPATSGPTRRREVRQAGMGRRRGGRLQQPDAARAARGRRRVHAPSRAPPPPRRAGGVHARRAAAAAASRASARRA